MDAFSKVPSLFSLQSGETSEKFIEQSSQAGVIMWKRYMLRQEGPSKHGLSQADRHKNGPLFEYKKLKFKYALYLIKWDENTMRSDSCKEAAIQ